MMHRMDMHTTATSSNESHSKSGNLEEGSSTSLLPERLQRRGSGVSVVIDPPEPGGEAESRKLPSSRYKGVVPQPNGRWGAQIYEKHQRVWLGTFNNEAEAARSYDVAAQRFRGRDAITNFKPLSLTDDADAAVLVFLNSRSKSEIVDMLRKHTYNDELQQSRTSSAAALCRLKVGINHMRGIGTGVGNRIGIGSDRPAEEHLFDKIVTPSDVGKLNRLVIPKQHAEKHFPLQVGRSNIAACKGVLLNFEDPTKKVWRFRYSYWNSSQSYVLTKGWTRFVKEKGLKAGDVVTFQRSTGPDRTLHIDWRPRTVMAGGGAPAQVLRLFGVNIVSLTSSSSIAACLNGEEGLSNNRRRNWRELELFPSQHYFHKKQCTELDQFRERLI